MVVMTGSLGLGWLIIQRSWVGDSFSPFQSSQVGFCAGNDAFVGYF